MRLHQTLIEEIIYLSTNYGGHAKEDKLRSFIADIRVSRLDDPTGSSVLANTRKIIEFAQARNLPTHQIVPLRLHPTVVDKIMYEYNVNSGHANEKKFRNGLSKLDLTPYERKTTGEAIVVLTEDYMKRLQGTQ